MSIRKARAQDTAFVLHNDKYIAPENLERRIALGAVYVKELDGVPIGYLRYNLFWDSKPFVNRIYIEEAWRGNGHGTALMEHWEEEMRQMGYAHAMAAASSDESAQHFYTRLGYRAIGGFTPEGEPYEILMGKLLTQVQEG